MKKKTIMELTDNHISLVMNFDTRHLKVSVEILDHLVYHKFPKKLILK